MIEDTPIVSQVSGMNSIQKKKIKVLVWRIKSSWWSQEASEKVTFSGAQGVGSSRGSQNLREGIGIANSEAVG